MPGVVQRIVERIRRNHSSSEFSAEEIAKQLDVSHHSRSTVTTDLLNSSMSTFLATDRAATASSFDISTSTASIRSNDSVRLSNTSNSNSTTSNNLRESNSSSANRTSTQIQGQNREDIPQIPRRSGVPITIEEPEEQDVPSGLDGIVSRVQQETSDASSVTTSDIAIKSAAIATSGQIYSDSPDLLRVRFSSCTIREYKRSIGDNPSSLRGVPLALGWELEGETTLSIFHHQEHQLQNRRSLQDLKVSSLDRVRLLKDAGYSSKEIYAATQRTDQDRRHREQTNKRMTWSRLYEWEERVWRGFLNATLRRRTKQGERTFLEPYRYRVPRQEPQQQRAMIANESTGTTLPHEGNMVSTSLETETAAQPSQDSWFRRRVSSRFKAFPKDSIRFGTSNNDQEASLATPPPRRSVQKDSRSASPPPLHLNMAGQVYD